LFDWDKYQPKNIHICTPRQVDKTFKKEMKKKPTPQWLKSESLFKTFKIITDELLYECFEFDWNAMTKPRFKENSNIEQIKAVLRKGYPYMYVIFQLNLFLSGLRYTEYCQLKICKISICFQLAITLF